MGNVSCFCVFVLVLVCLDLVQGKKYGQKHNEDDKNAGRFLEEFCGTCWKSYVEKVVVTQFSNALKQHEKEFKRLKRNDDHIKNHLRYMDKRLAITEEENRILKMQLNKRNVTYRCDCHEPLQNWDTSTSTPRTEAPSRTQRHARLIAASHGYDTKMVEIRLDNHQKKSISINTGYTSISAIAYDPSTNGIIWSRTTDDHNTRGIYLSSLADGGESSRLHPESATAMAVDTIKGWLIFTTRNSIDRIRLAGGGHALIRNMSRFSQQRGITLDPGSNLIFTCDGDYIIETDYTGKHQRVLLLGGFVVALTFDVDNNVLYFYEFDMIKKMWMKSGKTEVVKSGLGTRPKDFIYYDNRIYFVGMFEAYVKAYDLSKSTTVSLEQFDWNDVSLCLVS